MQRVRVPFSALKALFKRSAELLLRVFVMVCCYGISVFSK